MTDRALLQVKALAALEAGVTVTAIKVADGQACYHIGTTSLAHWPFDENYKEFLLWVSQGTA